MFEFKLADLGEGIHEGEILKWYVAVGDSIKEDEPLLDLETDKAAVTIPSPKAGKIVSVAGKAGDVVRVGQTMATIDDGTGGAVATPSNVGDNTRRGGGPVPAQPSPAPGTGTAGRAPTSIIAAPATRKLARELDVNIEQVKGTGPAGRITADDVKNFITQKPPAAAAVGAGAPQPGEPREGEASLAPTPTPRRDSDAGRLKSAPATTGERKSEYVPGTPPAATGSATAIPFFELEPLPDFSKFGVVEVEAFRSIRRKIARKMVTSMVLIPHVGHTDEADVTFLDEMRKRRKAPREGQPKHKLTLLPFVMKAVSLALKEFPRFNSSLDPFKEELVYKKYYNLGVAVDSPKGLLVPVVKETDVKSVGHIAADLESVAQRAREDKATLEDFQGSTFTITNLGSLGGVGLIPVINYPEVAILGMGQAREKPVVVDGQIVIRKMLPLTLGFDHRVCDGADAARFLSFVVRLLNDPIQLFLED